MRATKSGEKTKKYTMRSIVGLVQQIQPWFMPLCIIEEILATSVTFVELYLGKRIVDGIIAMDMQENVAQRDLLQGRLTKLALFLVGANMMIALLRWGIDKILFIMRRRIRDEILDRTAGKCLMMDYQVLEKAETLDLLAMAKEGSTGSGDIGHYCMHLANFVRNSINIIYGIVILSAFFWQFTVSGVVILFLLLILFWMQLYLCRKQNEQKYKFYAANVQGNRRFSSFGNFQWEYVSGKQIRIFRLSNVILPMMQKFKEFQEKNMVKLWRNQIGINAMNQILAGLGMMICYFLVGYHAATGQITAGEMTFYVGALTVITGSAITILMNYGTLLVQQSYLGNYAKMMDIRNEKYDGTLPIEKRLDNDYELEFRNVSFHYPNSEQLVLKNVTIKLNVSGKLAIVGKNGSGKSTFIKLLCRLYDPTEGEILLNGIDIRKYDYDEYRRIFGVVFQDFCLYPFSVAQNVAASVDYDRERVLDALERAGVAEDVAKMPQGLDTVIGRNEKDGVEFSGGEKQKLAIARTLYKDAAVVILDEPTAALDPVSEQEIYERFEEMVQEKTAIYISHRMSSCRFCEHVVVFEDGNIVQQGLHSELIQENGLYQQLWEAQAQYYV